MENGLMQILIFILFLEIAHSFLMQILCTREYLDYKVPAYISENFTRRLKNESDTD